METDWFKMIWSQFGASIDMLENAVQACPEDLWAAASEKPHWKENDVVGFWYVVYHTLFWLDRYLTNPPTDFVPRAPFTLDECDPAGILPERVYTKDEMLQYLQECREKCHSTIMSMSNKEALDPCGDWLPVSRMELLLYNLRHVQHHVGQLNLILRQRTRSAPGYVPRVGQ